MSTTTHVRILGTGRLGVSPFPEATKWVGTLDPSGGEIIGVLGEAPNPDRLPGYVAVYVDASVVEFVDNVEDGETFPDLCVVIHESLIEPAEATR